MNNLMLALALNVALLVVNVFAFIHLIRETYKRNGEISALRNGWMESPHLPGSMVTVDGWGRFAICGGCGVSAECDEGGVFRYHKCLVPADPAQSDLFSCDSRKIIAQGSELGDEEIPKFLRFKKDTQ